jgi:hypothetical protein
MRSSHSRRARKANRTLRPERLEARTFLSAWPVVDSFQLASEQISESQAMATDAAGNVYAAGSARDSAGNTHAIIREKAAGGTIWTTVEDFSPNGFAAFHAMAIDAAGDIYVGGEGKYNSLSDHWFVGERLASGSFSVVDSQTGGFAAGVAIDASGNVYATGLTSRYFHHKGKERHDNNVVGAQTNEWPRRLRYG